MHTYRLLKELMLFVQDAHNNTQNTKCSVPPQERADNTSLSVLLITHMCVMIPPPKKRGSPPQKVARRL